jgi:hypothetical protein
MNQFDHVKWKSLVEGKKLIGIFIYLWVLFAVFSLHRTIILNEPHYFYHQGFAFLNAWMLAKVMLAAEIFHVADNLKNKPLIYPIVLRSAVFTIILMSFYVFEEALLGMWHGKTIADSIPPVGGGSWQGILWLGGIMFVVLMPFFAVTEISRDLGEGKLYEVFFIRRIK